MSKPKTNLGGWVLAIIVTLITVVPILWVLMSSLKPSHVILSSPFALPSPPQWSNYKSAWTEANIGRATLNSLIACSITIVFLLPIGSMAAYVLSRYRFRGRQFIVILFQAGLMFPNFLAVVPLFLLMSEWKMVETLWGLVIVYVAYSLSFTIFVLMGFFQALPVELEEAAQLDGCTLIQTFSRILMPLAKPGLVVVGLFNLIGLWNEYNLAKVLVSGDNTTLPVGLAQITVNQFYKNDYGALFAAVSIVMVPVLVLYWLLRDKVHDAMLAGAIK